MQCMSLDNCVHQSYYHPSNYRAFPTPQRSPLRPVVYRSYLPLSSTHLIPIFCCQLKVGHDEKSAYITNQRFPHIPLRASLPAKCSSCPFLVNLLCSERQINIGLLLFALEIHVNGITLCILLLSINVCEIHQCCDLLEICSPSVAKYHCNVQINYFFFLISC